ncbi:hypothetical protein H5410_028140 [Solanum commersonii]|uniref:Uncharacterized protein n=1 Tax=Solanum commersonii TaxID=4109 RepID=A0A9J5Z3Y7_SOLCO|nr:hypothetical protein H5410_028140 [Solanum commersonii]
MMSSAIEANEIQIERNKKRRRDGHMPEGPTSTPLPVESSATKSNDIVIVVAKRKKEAEIEKVKSNRGHKSMKKSPVKGESVSKKATMKSKPVKGPGPRVQNLVEEKVMNREECIAKMEKQKVLNGRVFDLEILTEFGMSTVFYSVSLQSWNNLFEALVPYLHEPEVREFYYKMELLSDGGGGVRTTIKNVKIFLDEETLGIILGVPMKGIRSIEGCEPSNDFTK